MKAKSLLIAALAVLLVMGGAVGSVQAQSRSDDINVVVVWPAAGRVQGVGVNGKVVWPRSEAGRRIPSGNTVVIWPRKAKRRY
jgi:predicted Rdx family selenoprotein